MGQLERSSQGGTRGSGGRGVTSRYMGRKISADRGRIGRDGLVEVGTKRERKKIER